MFSKIKTEKWKHCFSQKLERESYGRRKKKGPKIKYNIMALHF